LSLIPKCRIVWLVLFWVVIGTWAFHSYFIGENSLSTLQELKETAKRLEREKAYWEMRNEILREKIKALDSNRDYYYEKLGRELFVRGKEGEEVFLFVK